MTREDFEKVFEATHQKALNAARRISLAYAEDAVSDAVVYCLENLGRFQQITPSYFIQKCVNRARDLVRNSHYDIVMPVGTPQELAVVEFADSQRRSGRAYNPESKKGRDTGEVLVNMSEAPRVVEGRQ